MRRRSRCFFRKARPQLRIVPRFRGNGCSNHLIVLCFVLRTYFGARRVWARQPKANWLEHHGGPGVNPPSGGMAPSRCLCGTGVGAVPSLPSPDEFGFSFRCRLGMAPSLCVDWGA